VPTASVGVVSYAIHGSVAWIPAVILAVGSVVGAQIGSWLLARIPQNRCAGVHRLPPRRVVMLFIVVPRATPPRAHVASGIGLAVLGLFTGVLAGLLGVGGGVIVVPALILLFGTSDLIAKGTSLLMMIPTAISGTVGNVKRRNVDLVAAALVGVAACTTTALGAWIATLLSPLVANILFACFLTFIAAQMAGGPSRSSRADAFIRPEPSPRRV
jgi:uncharacterized membrane protein YfcA